MKVSLRPHHFLCIQGYKGLNYNNAQTVNWSSISNILRNNPQTDIIIRNGKDDLCQNCPSELIKHKAYCKTNIVNGLDNKVAELLGLVTGQMYKYSDILERLNKFMTPQKHKELCGECAWWKKGVCKDTFEK